MIFKMSKQVTKQKLSSQLFGVVFPNFLINRPMKRITRPSSEEQQTLQQVSYKL